MRGEASMKSVCVVSSLTLGVSVLGFVTAAADTVIAPNAIVAGRICVGPPCQSGDSLPSHVVIRVEDATPSKLSPKPELAFIKENTFGTVLQRWKIFSSSTDALIFRSDSDGTVPFSISDNAPNSALDIHPSGNLGVGSSASGASLHVRRTDGTAKLLVEEASAVNVGRNMLHFKNNGAGTFKFENTGDATQWNFGTRNAGDFFIAFGAGLPLEYLFAQNGNLTIAGTLTENSDRSTKDGITRVDPQAVLSKLEALPISTWHVKADDADTRHMGPMAQDFAAAFGLGADARHIAPVDVGGVSLAAIQALNAKLNGQVQVLEERLSERDRQLESLLARVEALEATRGESPATMSSALADE
jgi:hypothetical protein